MLTGEKPSARLKSACVYIKHFNFFPSCGSVLLVAAFAQNTSTNVIAGLTFQVFNPCITVF